MEPNKIHVIQIKASSVGQAQGLVKSPPRVHSTHLLVTLAIFTPSDLPLHTEASRRALLAGLKAENASKEREQESRPRYFMRGYNDRPCYYFTLALMGIKGSKNCV